jgi:hypothetical protein
VIRDYLTLFAMILTVCGLGYGFVQYFLWAFGLQPVYFLGAVLLGIFILVPAMTLLGVILLTVEAALGFD